MRVAYTGCPLCDSVDLIDLVTVSCADHPLHRDPLPTEMTWRGCNSCGHVFTAGYFTSEALSVLFADSNESQRPGDHAEQKRLVWARTIGRVAEFCGGGSWLDVGFGDGSAMFTAAEWGYLVYGVDVRNDVVEAMQAFGFQATTGTLDDVDGTFDIVSMFDVLEHCPYPRDVIRSARERLTHDGLLVISCPNMGCFAWEVLDANGVNPYWGEIEHYHNFTRARLAALLNDAGFDVVSFGVSERWRLGMELIARKR